MFNELGAEPIGDAMAAKRQRSRKKVPRQTPRVLAPERSLKKLNLRVKKFLSDTATILNEGKHEL
jgi:hypothetical protein